MNYINKPPPLPSAYINGYLYVGIAISGALAASFSSDEAAKYIAPECLWYWRTGCATISAGLLALKMYRSTTFGQHLADQQSKEIEASKTVTSTTKPEATTPPTETK